MIRRSKISAKAIIFLGTLVFLAFAIASYQNFFTTQSRIQVGAVLPLTGKSAQYGIWIKEALELGKEEINSNGGIKGKMLEIIYEDDQASPAMAASAMQKLVNINKVSIVYGSWASSSVLAQAPIAESSKTILMAQAISPKISDAGDYVFRMQPDARYYIRELAPFVVKELGINSVSTLYVNNDFGVDQSKVFQSRFTELGGKNAFAEKFDQGASDFKAELSKVKNQESKAVFIPAYTEIAVVLKQARELGVKQQVLASVPFENPDILRAAGNASEGVIYPYHFDSDDSSVEVQDYQRKYNQKYGRPSEGVAALAYDGIRILSGVLKECPTEQDRECLKAALYRVHNFQGVTGSTTFDSKGDVVKPVIIKTVRNGKFVRYKKM
jgi:branched-chain amino acid transport system substrate-binding protein